MKNSGNEPTTWWQLHLYYHGQDGADALNDWLSSLEPIATSVMAGDHEAEAIFGIAPETETLWHHVHMTALFTQPLTSATEQTLDQYQAQGMLQRWHIETLSAQDWQTQCHQHHPARRYGQRLWVCPSWDTPAPGEHDIQVHLDPGVAFGTGMHPTTAMCLQWLDANIKHQPQLLDFGCGSGILAIAALRLGAQYAYAVDHDPQALEATRMNAQRNHVAAQLTVCVNADLPAIQADIVLANVLANPLIECEKWIASHTKPGGICVLSGILTTQLEQLKPHYKHDFQEIGVTTEDDWVCWILQRKGS